MRKRKEISGRYGKYTVIEEVDKTTARRFRCKCDCGNESIVRIDGLNRARLLKTGCAKCADRHIEHGDSKKSSEYNRLYIIWMGIANRCKFKEHYKDIERCPEWDDYLTFKEWSLDNGYSNNLTIDRKNGVGNYTPENCRWVTMQVQADNQRLISKSNTSGYRGVTQRGSKYEANLKVKGKTKYLGTFDTKEEAALAYNEALEEYGYEHRPRNKIKRRWE